MADPATPINGLPMPDGFPAPGYAAIFARAFRRRADAQLTYDLFVGAWGALAYRYLAVAECEVRLVASLRDVGTSPKPEERYAQERDLFAFFSNGFSVFESYFFALFCLGAFHSPSAFPLQTNKEQQKISVITTSKAINDAFPADPINGVLNAVIADSAFIEWREIRNILTHRSAPGRTFYVGYGGDLPLADTWKIKNIALDANMAPTRTGELTRLLKLLIEATEHFAKTHL